MDPVDPDPDSDPEHCFAQPVRDSVVTNLAVIYSILSSLSILLDLLSYMTPTFFTCVKYPVVLELVFHVYQVLLSVLRKYCTNNNAITSSNYKA